MAITAMGYGDFPHGLRGVPLKFGHLRLWRRWPFHRLASDQEVSERDRGESCHAALDQMALFGAIKMDFAENGDIHKITKQCHRTNYGSPMDLRAIQVASFLCDPERSSA